MRKIEIWDLKAWDLEKKEYPKTNFRHGIFHKFGTNYEDFETNAGNFTTVIVELEDGSIINHPAGNSRFIDSLKQLDNNVLNAIEKL